MKSRLCTSTNVPYPSEVPVRAPLRTEAGLTRPELISTGENAFGINDLGVVVGSMGVPADPCAPANASTLTEPKAFVRLPVAPTRLGLAVVEGFIAGAQALGFAGLAEFSSWIATADEESADAAVATIFAFASSIDSPPSPPEGGAP